MKHNTCLDCGKGISAHAKRCPSCAAKARWANAEWRQRVIAKLNSPEELRRRSELSKALWQDKEHRSRQAQLSRKRWADPEYKARMSAIMAEAKSRPDRIAAFKQLVKDMWADPDFREQHTGKNHRCWRGGASRKRYPPEFSEQLRRAVRERDGFHCILCGKPERDRTLSVHHVDGDKHNNTMANLVSLHRSCHQIVHTRGDFDYWRVGFLELTRHVREQ